MTRGLARREVKCCDHSHTQRLFIACEALMGMMLEKCCLRWRNEKLLRVFSAPVKKPCARHRLPSLTRVPHVDLSRWRSPRTTPLITRATRTTAMVRGAHRRIVEVFLGGALARVWFFLSERFRIVDVPNAEPRGSRSISWTLGPGFRTRGCVVMPTL